MTARRHVPSAQLSMLMPLDGAACELSPGLAEIPIVRCIVPAVVDADVAEWAASMKWHINKGGYIFAGTRPIISLHRRVMGDPPGAVVDHIDGDTFNNTRKNLRILTKEDNARSR